MANYKLNEEAKDDLKRIYRYGFENFGETRADAYYMALFARFDEIADNPYSYPSAEHIKPGYRRSVCGVDVIYYKVVDGVPMMMRVLGRQDAREELP